MKPAPRQTRVASVVDVQAAGVVTAVGVVDAMTNRVTHASHGNLAGRSDFCCAKPRSRGAKVEHYRHIFIGGAYARSRSIELQQTPKRAFASGQSARKAGTQSAAKTGKADDPLGRRRRFFARS